MLVCRECHPSACFVRHRRMRTTCRQCGTTAYCADCPMEPPVIERVYRGVKPLPPPEPTPPPPETAPPEPVPLRLALRELPPPPSPPPTPVRRRRRVGALALVEVPEPEPTPEPTPSPPPVELVALPEPDEATLLEFEAFLQAPVVVPVTTREVEVQLGFPGMPVPVYTARSTLARRNVKANYVVRDDQRDWLREFAGRYDYNSASEALRDIIDIAIASESTQPG